MRSKRGMNKFGLLCMVLFSLVAGPAAAQQGGAYFGLDFPLQIMGAGRSQITDYENRGHPGLGYSAAYAHRDWKADVYIYDLRKTTISGDPNSSEIRDQLAQATRDVTSGGYYSEVVVGDKFVIEGTDGEDRFSCISFTYVHKQIGPARSALCLAGWRNKFIKIRLTSPVRNDAPAAMRTFASEWVKILWPRGI